METQIDATTVENSIEVLEKKKKNRTTIRSRNSTPGYISEKNKRLIQKGTCTPMFIAALFTIAKSWKQPRCPSTDEWIKKFYKVVPQLHIYIYIYIHTHTHIQWNITQP